ncbi:inositol monophosphatase family protein [uncultured Jatrophihabitans sp.]|uniref:inositol monophosphatase family protein n=1 Tax=uncultured Jatrophihabitans sp. TaxID=1610747 RepID=UPI0035CB06AB
MAEDRDQSASPSERQRASDREQNARAWDNDERKSCECECARVRAATSSLSSRVGTSRCVSDPNKALRQAAPRPGVATISGACQDGAPLAASPKTNLSAALVGTGQASPRETTATYESMGRTITAMLGAGGVVRVSVPATLQLIRVVAGRTDVFWQHSAVRSGLLAGALLVHEAGGAVTDLDGQPWTLASADFLAAVPALHPAAAAILRASRNGRPRTATAPTGVTTRPHFPRHVPISAHLHLKATVMHIAVLAASGNTGGHLTRVALARGHTVTALVRDPRRLDLPLSPQLRTVALADAPRLLLPRSIGRATVAAAMIDEAEAAAFARQLVVPLGR